MLLDEFIQKIQNKYSTDVISLQDLIVDKNYRYRKVGRALFQEMMDMIINHAQSIEDRDRRIEFKTNIRDEAAYRSFELISGFTEMAKKVHFEMMNEEAIEIAHQIYSKYFNNPINTLNTLAKDYLPMNDGNPENAISKFVNDISSELRGAFYTLDIAGYSSDMYKAIHQIYSNFQSKAANNLIELYGEWAGVPREPTSLPELTHVPPRTAKNKNLNNKSIQMRNQMTQLSKTAQEPLAPAHIVKHEYVHQVNITYVTAPTLDPRTRKPVLDPRTGQASTPYYVFVRVDKVPINVRPGEASAPQTDIYRYKAPAKTKSDAQNFAKAKVGELQRVLPNVKPGKTTRSTLPYPFGLMSTPELDAPDKPAAPTVASLEFGISSIYDSAKDLEDIIYNMNKSGSKLDDSLKSKLLVAQANLDEVHSILIKDKKRVVFVPALLSMAHDLEVLGRKGLSQKIDAVAAKIVRNAKEDLIHGGLADEYEAKNFDPEQLAMGLKVEMEHTDDPELALEIAMDHLVEDKKYYDHLEKMESEMDKK